MTCHERHLIARNFEALAAWYRAGACDTCITDYNASWSGIHVGVRAYDPESRRDRIVFYPDGAERNMLECLPWDQTWSYSGCTPALWVHRWIELPPERRPQYGEWKFLKDYNICPRL